MKKHVKQNLSKQLTFQLIILKKKYIQKTSQTIEIIPEILKQFLSEFSFLKGTNQYIISAITSIIVNTTKTVFLASITLHLRSYFLISRFEFILLNLFTIFIIDGVFSFCIFVFQLFHIHFWIIGTGISYIQSTVHRI